MLFMCFPSFLLPRRFVYHALAVLGAFFVLSVWLNQSISADGAGLGMVLFAIMVYGMMSFLGFIIPTVQSQLKLIESDNPGKNLHSLLGFLLT